MKSACKNIVRILLPFLMHFTHAQSIDIEQAAKETKVKVNGSINGNSIYYQSNMPTNRIPLTYFLQGKINISWATLSVPFTYSFSNQGENFNYKTPFDFNRFSLHPKYKWIQAHIGTVTMTFSPYTLNGHQFVGGGVELTPDIPFKFSGMYGVLNKAIPPDGNPETTPTYKRIGYGVKMRWEKRRYSIGLIGFYAKDNANSLGAVAGQELPKPKENLTIGIDAETTLARRYVIKVEYASSAITKDTRAAKSNTTPISLAGLLFNNRISTEYYKAFKTSLDVDLKGTKLGVGYERVDPNYETLGAYFFNNDFENITLNSARNLFNNKVNLSFNIGYQRDNLNKQKNQSTGRTIGSVNATYQMTKDITLSGSYSNMSAFTNKNLNQFDDINDNDLTDEEIEALNFKQLSQTSTINLDWMLVKKKTNTQNLNINYSLASSANKENDIIRVGQANNFHNATTSYTVGFPTRALTFATTVNYNYSDVGRDNSNTIGGTFNVGKQFFKKRLSTSLGTSYSKNRSKDIVGNTLNFRATAATVFAKKHNVNLNLIQSNRGKNEEKTARDLSVTLGYSYAFDLKRPKWKFKKKDKVFAFSYKEYRFSGAHEEITEQLKKLTYDPKFKDIIRITKAKNDLQLLEKELVHQHNASDKAYKKSAITYLDYLYKNKNFIKKYQDLLFVSLKELYNQSRFLGEQFRADYNRLAHLIKERKRKGEKISSVDHKNLRTREIKMKAHQWMRKQLKKVTYEKLTDATGMLKTFNHQHISWVYDQIEKTKEKDVVGHLTVKLAKFYHNYYVQNKF